MVHHIIKHILKHHDDCDFLFMRFLWQESSKLCQRQVLYWELYAEGHIHSNERMWNLILIMTLDLENKSGH